MGNEQIVTVNLYTNDSVGSILYGPGTTCVKAALRNNFPVLIVGSRCYHDSEDRVFIYVGGTVLELVGISCVPTESIANDVIGRGNERCSRREQYFNSAGINEYVLSVFNGIYIDMSLKGTSLWTLSVDRLYKSLQTCCVGQTVNCRRNNGCSSIFYTLWGERDSGILQFKTFGQGVTMSPAKSMGATV